MPAKRCVVESYKGAETTPIKSKQVHERAPQPHTGVMPSVLTIGHERLERSSDRQLVVKDDESERLRQDVVAARAVEEGTDAIERSLETRP